MRLTRGLRGGGSLSLLSCSCSSTTGLSLPASTYSCAKGVCLFSFILPELDPATYAWWHLLSFPWGVIFLRSHCSLLLDSA